MTTFAEAAQNKDAIGFQQQLEGAINERVAAALEARKSALAEDLLDERAKMHLHIKAGAFHEWLGKDPSEPITDADIQKGLKAGGHPAKMAQFAKNARGWSHSKHKE